MPAPLWVDLYTPWPIRPIHLPGVSGNPFGIPMTIWYTPKQFQCPNTIILYINIYLSTISRLLVMSVLSFGTLNNIRSQNNITHITLTWHRMLSVQTLWVQELCRHDRDTSPVNIQKQNLDAHIGSYIFYEDLYWLIRYDNIRNSLSHRYVTCPRFDRRYLHTYFNLPASLFTCSVIYHPATNSLVTLLARLLMMCITERARRYLFDTWSDKF